MNRLSGCPLPLCFYVVLYSPYGQFFFLINWYMFVDLDVATSAYISSHIGRPRDRVFRVFALSLSCSLLRSRSLFVPSFLASCPLSDLMFNMNSSLNDNVRERRRLAAGPF
jgi:hypothetical protein